jgi:hypothetical protein
MDLGLRSSEREKERKKERKRELERAYLNSHKTPDKTGEVLYIYYNRLTLAPRHINYCSINTGG